MREEEEIFGIGHSTLQETPLRAEEDPSQSFKDVEDAEDAPEHDSTLKTTGASPQDPMHVVDQEHSVTFTTDRGISNSGVDCYLNSALQLLKTLYQHRSPATRETIRQHHGENSFFIRFFEGKIDTTLPSMARFLRKDADFLMSQSNALLGEDQSNIDERGNCMYQADPMDVLRALLPHIQSPLYFGIKRSRLDENGSIAEVDTSELQSNTRDPEFFIPCTLSLEESNQVEEVNIHDLLRQALQQEHQAYFNEARKQEDQTALQLAQIHALESGSQAAVIEPHYDHLLLEKKNSRSCSLNTSPLHPTPLC